jgi:phosphinothricin acetyltransferase
LRLLERQGFRSAYGVATAPNPGSEALHRAVGFELIGRLPRVGWKFGAWHDVLVWRIALGAEDAEPTRLLRPEEVWPGIEDPQRA